MAKNEAKIKFTAETGEFNNQIKAANDEMSMLRAELKLNETQMKATGTTVEGLENKHKILSNQLKASEDKTEALNQKVQKAVEIFGENSAEATKLKTQLLNAQNAEEKIRQEVDRCNKELEEQKNVSDKVDKSLKNLEDSAGNAGDGFTVLKGTLADLASSAIQMVIGKISEFVGYLADLPAATMELRQDLATLTTSFDNMGFSTATAKDTWKDLYAVFGEDDRAVETANHISKMADNQKELSEWVDITTGVFATYQDSLPVEGLAEASNETAKTGKVTGVLADALNWSAEAATMFAGYMSEDVVTAEDAFNEALKECTTEEEKQALITDTLTKLYGSAADTYRDTAGAQMEAKEATAENMLAETELANSIEPVTTAFTNLKTTLLTAFQPAIEKVSGLMTDALEWANEHPVAMKAIAAAVGVLTVGLGGLAVAVGVYTAAQWAMNSAVLANPMTWAIAGIIAAIAGLVAVLVVVIEYWDEIVSAVKNCWETVKSVLSQWGDWISTNVIQPVVNFFTDLWQKLQAIWTNICNVVQTAFMLISSIISAAVDIITLPFQFIWENCKEYVFSAFEWIKSKISSAVEFLKNLVSVGFGFIKDKIVTPITNAKNKAVELFNNIKSSVSEKISSLRSKVSEIFNSIKDKIMTPINNAKSKVTSTIESLRSSFSSKIESLRSKVSSIFTSIKDKIVKPIETAKTKVKSVVDAIKGFFTNMKLSLPKIKLPHFKVSGKLSIDPPSVPKLSIEWYKNGGIMTRPTIFGVNGSSLMAGGEAGAEAILPIEKLKDYIADTVESKMNVVNLGALADAVERLADRDINLNINGRNFATATASDSDNVNGLRTSFKGRGLAL